MWSQVQILLSFCRPVVRIWSHQQNNFLFFSNVLVFLFYGSGFPQTWTKVQLSVSSSQPTTPSTGSQLHLPASNVGQDVRLQPCSYNWLVVASVIHKINNNHVSQTMYKSKRNRDVSFRNFARALFCKVIKF